MVCQVKDAKYISGYVIWLRFADGTEGEVDLKDELDGVVFEPLRDIELFKTFRVHPELHTVVWSNGADFAPEFLYERAQIALRR